MKTKNCTQITDACKAVEKAEEAVAHVRSAIAKARSCERSWLNRLTELDGLSLAAMAKAFEDCTGKQSQGSLLDSKEFDELVAEMTLTRQRLETIPKLVKHLNARDVDLMADFNAEQANLTRLENKAKYLEQRSDLIQNPRSLPDVEGQIFWMAAFNGGYRDDHDAFRRALDLYVELKAKGATNGPFVWPESVQG